MKPKIILWKWKTDGWRRGYTHEHVNNMCNMLKKHITVPYDVLCVTDDPTGIECETYPLWNKPQVRVAAGRPNCYKRLFLFSNEAKKFGDRLISMDIDTLIVKNIDDVISYNETPFKAMVGTCATYNGSIWSVRPGELSHVWDDFNDNSPAEVIKNTRRSNGKPYYGSDQAWISYKAPPSPTWGDDDGFYQFHSGRSWATLPDNMRVMFAAGGIKFWDIQMRKAYPHLYDMYKEQSK